MQMGETGENCKIWEEEMFWTHFQTVHFVQFLHDDFEKQLALPEKFVKRFKEKLPETVTLKSPSGSTWDVGLTKNMNTLFFDRGWPSFVEDQSLKEKDFLIFKYNGGAHFDVLMFEGLSLCEKAASYFVRKCDTKIETKGSPVEIMHASSEVGLAGTPKKSAENDSGKRKMEKVSSSIHSKPKKKFQYINNCTTTLENKKYSSAGDDRRPVCLALCAQSRTGTQKPEIGRGSSKMTIEADEIKAAESIGSSFPCFTKAMRKFNIKSSYIVNVPLKFSMAYLPTSKTEIVLRNLQGECWKVNSSPDSNGRTVLCGGWINFVRGNDIKEGDICTFELVSKNEMRVHISRVESVQD